MSFFLFNETPPTELYTLSLHDALPICPALAGGIRPDEDPVLPGRETAEDLGGQRLRSGKSIVLLQPGDAGHQEDRKSTRLNSSHVEISYAVFCLKKKNRRCVGRRTAPS